MMLELGDNELETGNKVKFLKGSRGLGIFVNQTIQYSKNVEPQDFQANKILSHAQAEELRDFLNEKYPVGNNDAK